MRDINSSDIKEQCDGISFLPELLGKKQKEHEYLYWEFHEHGGKQVVRKGNWKTVRLNMSNNPNATIELYDLSIDPSEKNDIAQQHPEIVSEMAKIMKDAHLINERLPFESEYKLK